MSNMILHNNGVYNIYSSIADAPLLNNGCGVAELKDWIECHHGQSGLDALPERLQRAHICGSSSLGGQALGDVISCNRAGSGGATLSKEDFIARFLSVSDGGD